MPAEDIVRIDGWDRSNKCDRVQCEDRTVVDIYQVCVVVRCDITLVLQCLVVRPKLPGKQKVQNPRRAAIIGAAWRRQRI